MSDAIARHLPYVAVVNFLAVSALLVVLGRLATARPLEALPGPVQNAAEAAIEWFVVQARRVDPAAVRIVAPFLGTLFLSILFSNLLAVLPIPAVGFPPTAYYSVPLALALVAVLGALAIGARLGGPAASLKHLFWPNPLQLVSELSHTLSLSLRLYGNIGGELIVALLAAQAIPYGIPLVIHALGLVPAVVQPIVFTLLTANFLATALHGRHERARAEPPPLAPAGAPGADRSVP